MGKIENGWERLKDIVENEAEKETKEQQENDDDEQYGMVPNIKLVYKRTCVIEFRVTGNLNNGNTKMIMINITPDIEMRTKVVYSFKSEI